MESRVVVGHVKPILLRDVRIGRLFGQLTPQKPSEVMADVDHPITKALMEQLPKMENPALQELRVFLTDPERGGEYSASKQEDVDSWIGLVDLEIEHRRSEAGVAFRSVMSLFKQRKR